MIFQKHNILNCGLLGLVTSLIIPKLWLSLSWYSSLFVPMNWTSYKWKPAEVLSGRPGSFVRITGAEGDCVTWCLHIIKSARDRVRKHIARANLAWQRGRKETRLLLISWDLAWADFYSVGNTQLMTKLDLWIYVSNPELYATNQSHQSSCSSRTKSS